MDHFGRFALVPAIGNVQRRQQSGIERFILAVREAMILPHPRPVEIHIDQTFIDLRDPVLQSGGDTQFLGLHAKHQRRLNFAGNSDPIEFHEASQRGDDNRAGAGQPDLPRDVALVANRKVLRVQRKSLAATVFDELLDGGLHQPDPAVVTVQADIADQFVDRVESGLIVPAENDLDAVPFVKGDFRVEVAHNQGQRLAEVAVRGIADQPGTCTSPFSDQLHGRRPL